MKILKNMNKFKNCIYRNSSLISINITKKEYLKFWYNHLALKNLISKIMIVLTRKMDFNILLNVLKLIINNMEFQNF
jgi:predicted metal-binding transcription factor (methanogenesis marker protein 9)